MALSCRRPLSRLTSGAEPKHWRTDPEYEFSTPHPKVSITTIKSRVQADASTKYSGLAVIALQGFCSTKRFGPEMTVSHETTL